MIRVLSTLALVAGLAFTAPAQAGGTFTLNIGASTAEDAHAIRTGLALIGVAKDIRSHGKITQRGFGHVARLAQGGRGNLGIIHQEGSHHDADLSQTGGGNACGIFQFGNGASSQVHQTGGQACIVVQAGF